MLTTLTIPRAIEEQMRQVNQRIEQILYTENSVMGPVMSWVLQSRGKQLRPLLLLLSASYGTWNDQIIEMAAILEIAHMASLVHDDIVDDATLRRGQPSVQSRFGKNIAVYAGDYMIFSVLAKLSFIPSKRQQRFYQALGNMCEGELLQYKNIHNADITEEDYFTQIRGKTATLFRLACTVGASQSRCKKPIADALERYGLDLGMLFQLQDDLHDLMGSAHMEKNIRSDLSEGVYTLPVIYALKQAERGPLCARSLEEYHRAPSADTYQKLQNAVVAAGGVEYTLARMQDYKRQAESALERLPGREETGVFRDILDGLFQGCAAYGSAGPGDEDLPRRRAGG